MTRRRICIFTATRAEYGLLRWLVHDLAAMPQIDLQILASGSHFSQAFGETWREIEQDGTVIAARVEMLLDSDTASGMSTSLGLGVLKYGDTLDRLRPDLAVVLGDRYEALAFAAACTCHRVPLAHLHGGEATEGAIDDAIRNAISALAHLHFPAAESYGRRIRQMGAAADRVVVVGAPALDNLARLDLLSPEALAADVGLPEEGPLLLVTYHPETMANDGGRDGGKALLAALDRFSGARVLATHANQDAGGRALNTALDAWAATRGPRVRVVPSLGVRRYLSAVKAAAVVVGNSSSGIIEAPAAGTAVVNVGQRQKGRLRAPAVIDCPASEDDIVAAIGRALHPDFQAMAALAETPYGAPGASARIARKLAETTLDNLLSKPFQDMAGEP